MARLNRIQCVNFLRFTNKKGTEKSREWKPAYRDIIFNMHCVTSAIVLLNGHGKTSLTHFFFHLMARRDFLSTVTSRSAPRTFGAPTHFRVELGLFEQDNGAQKEFDQVHSYVPPSKTLVFGMWCYRGEEPHFYYYQGKLEDCHVTLYDTERRLTYLDETALRRHLLGMPQNKDERTPWISDKNEWRERVGAYIDPRWLEVQAKFHRKGGGDKSADLQSVEPYDHERFDQAFFRMVAAPELLANLKGHAAEDDEVYVEDSLLLNYKSLCGAEFECDDTEKRVRDLGAALGKLNPVLAKAQAFETAKSAEQETAIDFASDATLLHRLVARDPIPGLLSRRNLPVGPAQDLLDYLCVDERHSFRILDAGLAKLSGLELPYVNQRASEKSIASKIRDENSQVIDFASYFKFSEEISGSSSLVDTRRRERGQVVDSTSYFKTKGEHGGRRTSHKAYLFQHAHELLTALGTNPKFVGDVNRALSIMQQAFSWAQTVGDTNVYRTQLHPLRIELEALRSNHDVATTRKLELAKEFEAIKTQADFFEHAKVAYQKAQASSLFTEQELSSPNTTAEGLFAALSEKNSQLSAFSAWHGEWKPRCQAYDNFVAANNGQTPDLVLKSLEHAVTVAAGIVQQRTDMRGAAEERVAVCTTQWSNAQAECDQVAARLAHAERLHMLAAPYSGLFGDIAPEQIDVSVRLHEAQSTRNRLWPAYVKIKTDYELMSECAPLAKRYAQLFGQEETEVAAQAPAHLRAVCDQIERLHAERKSAIVTLRHHRQFQRLYPGQRPTQWLAERDEKLRQLAIEERDANDALANAAREQKELQNNPAAAPPIAASALSSIRDKVPFEEVHQVIARICVDRVIQERWLTVFSSLLHAPVVTTPAHALTVATLLDKGKYPIPVFLLHKLVLVLAETPSPMMNSDAMAEWIFSGLKTPAVDCIVNPERREEAQRVAAQRFSQAREECKRIIAVKDALAENASSVILARQACNAEGADLPEKTTVLRCQQRTLYARRTTLGLQASSEAQAFIPPQRHFERLLKDYGANAESTVVEQYDVGTTALANADASIHWWEVRNSEEARTAVRAAKELQALGANGNVSELQAHLHEATNNQTDSHAQLDQATSTLNGTRNDERDARSAHERESMKRAQSEKQLSQLSADGQSSHYKKMQRAEQDQSALILAQQVAQRRLEYKQLLADAQPYADRQGQADGDDAYRGAEIEAEVVKLDHALKQIDESQQALQKRLSETEILATDLHTAAVIVRNQAYIIESSPYFPEVARPFIRPPETHTLYTASERLRAALSVDSDSIDIEAHIANLREAAGMLNCSQTAANYAEAAKRTLRTEKEFVDGIGSLMKAHEQGELRNVPALAFDSLRGSPSSIAVEQVRMALEVDLQESAALLDKAKKGTEKARAMVKASLIQLAKGAGDKLSIMQSAMQTTKEATFNVQAAIAPTEVIEEGWETIYRRIKLRLNQLRTEGSSLSASAFSKREEKKLKEEIRTEVLALLFLNTSVEFQHPTLTEGMVELDLKEYSEGQKAAINLMWIAKLAEFKLLQVMQSPGQQISNSRFKKAMRTTDYFLWIDGLFSNLSSDDLIEPSMQSLRNTKDHFQLVGWIHNQNYINNYAIFPVSISGRLAARKAEAKVGDYIMLDHSAEPGAMALFNSRLDPLRPQ